MIEARVSTQKVMIAGASKKGYSWPVSGWKLWRSLERAFLLVVHYQFIFGPISWPLALVEGRA